LVRQRNQRRYREQAADATSNLASGVDRFFIVAAQSLAAPHANRLQRWRNRLRGWSPSCIDTMNRP
jgi:hypothetical protein